MFKVVQLDEKTDDAIQTIQKEYDVDAVSLLGRDGQNYEYVLIEYDTKADQNVPTSGSLQAEKPKKAKRIKREMFEPLPDGSKYNYKAI